VVPAVLAVLTAKAELEVVRAEQKATAALMVTLVAEMQGRVGQDQITVGMQEMAELVEAVEAVDRPEALVLFRVLVAWVATLAPIKWRCTSQMVALGVPSHRAEPRYVGITLDPRRSWGLRKMWWLSRAPLTSTIYVHSHRLGQFCAGDPTIKDSSVMARRYPGQNQDRCWASNRAF
jgi:hypothetical protein